MRRPVFLSHLGGRFSRGVFWSLIGTGFAQGSMFLTAIILARMLGKDVFGELGMIQSTLLTFSSVAQIATGVTATKYVAEFRDADKARAGRVLGLCAVLTLGTGLAATVLLAVGASWMAEHLLAAPHLAVGLSISAAFVLFSVMNGYQVGALAGLESYKSISVYGALLGAAHLALCGLGAVLWGLHGALGSMAVSALLRWAVYATVLRREIDKQGIVIQRREGLRERKILYRFALPAALSGLTSMPAIWLGNAMLVRQPDGYAEMGVYSAANNLRMLVLLFPLLINNVGLSLLNNTRGGNDLLGYREIFWANVRVTLLATLIGALTMAALGAPLLHMFGHNFSMGYSILLILMLSTVPEVLAIAGAQVIQSQEKMWHSLLIVAIPRDVLMVSLAYVVVPVYGADGLAWSYSVSWIVALAAVMTMVRKIGLRVSS